VPQRKPTCAAPKTRLCRCLSSPTAHAKVILGAEQTQNIIEICRNINGICKNITDIFENINGISSSFRAVFLFRLHKRPVSTAPQLTAHCASPKNTPLSFYLYYLCNHE
jgi:hypothetical protein